MTNITSTVLELFEKKVNIDVSYTIRDLKNILSEAYKQARLSSDVKKNDTDDNDVVKQRKQRIKRDRDENGAIIKKREPSAYNLFIRDQTAKIKMADQTLDSKLVFKMAINEWNKHKETGKICELVDADDTDNVCVEAVKVVEAVEAVDTDVAVKAVDTDVAVTTIDTAEEEVMTTKSKKARKPKKVDALED